MCTHTVATKLEANVVGPVLPLKTHAVRGKLLRDLHIQHFHYHVNLDGRSQLIYTKSSSPSRKFVKFLRRMQSHAAVMLFYSPNCSMASLPVYSSAAMMPIAANIAKRPLLISRSSVALTPEIAAHDSTCKCFGSTCLVYQQGLVG